MALIIRLRQQGKNNQRSFRLVVTDERSPRDGKYVEKLGSYDPRFEDKLEIDADRVKYWLDHGALISNNAEILVSKKAPEVIKQYKEQKVKKKISLLRKKKESKKTRAKQ